MREVSQGHTEPTRARYPDTEGFIERGGVSVFYEVYGRGSPTVLLLPPWTLIPSRAWKGQIPTLARHHRVVAFDPRGNGRSDRPKQPEAYGMVETAADAIAVLDETGTDRAVTVSLAAGGLANLLLCAQHPDRVLGAAFLGPLVPVCEPMPPWSKVSFNQRRDTYVDWEQFNRHYISEQFSEFVRWWMEKATLPERHCTVPLENGIEWGLQTTPEIVIASLGPLDAIGGECVADLFAALTAPLSEMAGQIRCPTLVLSGSGDMHCPPEWGARLAELSGGRAFTFAGAGHGIQGRHPVAVNLALRDFIQNWVESPARPI